MRISGKGVCFTGHRPQKLFKNYCEDSMEMKEIIYKLEELIVRSIDEGFDTFYTGMAQGVDILAAEIIIRRRVSGIKLVAVIPFTDQTNRWPIEWVKRHDAVRKNCDVVLTLSEKYYGGCFADRNAFMVENSERVIAVYNGKAGGTHNTIRLARLSGREVITVLAPCCD